jgi:hypothetical protein
MQAPASSMEGVFPLPTAIPEPSASSTPTEALHSSEVAYPTAPWAAASEDTPADPPRLLPASWTAALLSDQGDFSVAREAARFGVGIGLAALYGVSLGARQGGRAFFAHAAGVPAALLAVSALGVPALYIVLALFDAPIAPPRVASAAARAAARSGLLLAGLAPAAALFVVSSDRPETAAVAGALGLFVAGALGLHGLLRELRGSLKDAPLTTRATAGLAFLGFGVFAVALAARIWWATLPLIGGAA